MMDRNREARRAVVMANGLQHRRRPLHQHRSSSTNPAEDDGGIGLQEAARLRDRTVKDRDREIRDRERERMIRSNNNKRRKSDESSDDSVNDDEDYDDDGAAGVSTSNHVHVSSPPAGVSLTSQRKSYPPPSKVYRVAPTWKAPDEMIGVSIPRKARSASAKRSQEYWNSGGLLESSSSPMRSDMAAASTTARVPSPSSAPMSPSSSNVSMKKKIKSNGQKHRPPKPTSKSSPSIQDEIEIEVAEVLYGLMRQTQAPASSSKQESMSNDSPAAAPLTVAAPKRKRPRLHPDESQRSSTTIPKPDANQPPKLETEKLVENGVVKSLLEPVTKNGIVSEKMSEESVRRGENEMVWSAAKVEQVSSSSPKLESSHNLDDRVNSSSTFTKPNSIPVEQQNRRPDKFEIDLMAPASPEKEEEVGKYGGREVIDKKSMVTDRDRETDTKSKQNEVEDLKSVKMDSGSGAGCAELSREPQGGDESKATGRSEPQVVHQKTKMLLSSPPPQQEIKPNGKERNLSLQLDLEKTGVNNDRQKQQQHLPKNSIKDDCNLNSKAAGGQPSSVPFPMSMPAGWHGGLSPMGYVGPLQGVVSMDGTTTMAPTPIQPTPPHFLLSQPKPKRCATHCHIARSISVHQQMMKISPFWPPVAAAPLFGAKPSNMNMVPSAELHSGRGGVLSLAQDNKSQPLAFFPGQPSPVATKDKNFQATSVSDSAQKSQLLLQPGLPPGAATNMMHAPALFFPMGQQQATASTRPGSGKSPSTANGSASTSALTSAPMGAAVSNASPAMSFSYPNMNGNEAQFMAILGNGSYPFPIPAHVGAPPPYRGSHPQAMPFFNGSFYPSQMLHPSQLQQNYQNPSMSTAPSSSSHKHVQNQQHSQGNSPNIGNPNQNSSMQNLQTAKSRDMGGEDSPSTTADSRNRPNMSVYGQNFVMPFHAPNFALMPSSLGGSNHGDKKHHQQQSSQQAALNSPFPMSFATINGATTPGLDISSMSMPEAAKYSYQMMAAAAAQAAQQGKTEHRGPENGKPVATDPSKLDEDRRGMTFRASASSVGQSIAFSRDTAENTVVDSSARSLKQQQPQQQQQQQQSHQQQQQQSQLLFSKQQLYTPPASSNSHSKTHPTSNRNVYPDNLPSSSVMGSKFPSNLSGFPIGGSTQSQWMNSVRPNTSQMSSPSITTTSSPSNVKNLSQQQGRSQSQTHISFGASQGQQTAGSSHAPVGSPSNSSVSKSNGGSPRTSASNKSLGQPGKNSPSHTQNTQKPSILGSPHLVSSQGSSGKPPSQQPHSQQAQLSKQSIQQAQLYFNNYMQASTSAGMVGTGYYLQQQQQLQQHMQQQQLQQHMQQQLQGSKSKGSAPPISSTTCSPVTSSDPAKAVGAAGQMNTAASNSKGGLHPLGMYHTDQSSGGAHQPTPASFPYVNAASPAVPVKPGDQKQPAGD